MSMRVDDRNSKVVPEALLALDDVKTVSALFSYLVQCLLIIIIDIDINIRLYIRRISSSLSESEESSLSHLFMASIHS